MTYTHVTKTCLQVLPALGTGGVERGTIDIAAGLVASGWRALVASEGGHRVRELERVGAEHVQLPLARKSPWALKSNATALAHLMEQEKVSLVHARSRAPAWSAYWAATRRGLPFVTTFHGVYGVGPFGLKKKYNAVMTKGRPTIAISNFVADHIEKEYRLNKDLITIIPRGVDLNLFDPDAVSSARMVDLATKWRLPDDGPVVMLPGRLTSWKGQSLLIDALAKLNDRNALPQNWRCLLVGPHQARSDYGSRLKSRIQRRGLDGCIQIIDDCRDMPAAYMVTDVVVSGSMRPEAFGRVVAEAQAMGRPVIAPDHGAASEVLVPGVTGWLFTPGDPSSMAGALERAIALGQPERSLLAERARSHVAENFDNTEMVQRTLDLYENVLSHALGRSSG